MTGNELASRVYSQKCHSKKDLYKAGWVFWLLAKYINQGAFNRAGRCGAGSAFRQDGHLTEFLFHQRQLVLRLLLVNPLRFAVGDFVDLQALAATVVRQLSRKTPPPCGRLFNPRLLRNIVPQRGPLPLAVALRDRGLVLLPQQRGQRHGYGSFVAGL